MPLEHGGESPWAVVAGGQGDVDHAFALRQSLQGMQQACLLPPAAEAHAGIARKQALHDMLCDTLVVDKWAFTERPDLQRRELGAVTIVVLVVLALMVVVATVAIGAALVMAARGFH